MNHINVKKAVFAFGATGAILYLGCMIIMVTTGRAGFIKFTNSILHGFDV